ALAAARHAGRYAPDLERVRRAGTERPVRTVRAAAHVHSEWSYDASWALPDLARAFARRGYDVVLMAEHDRGFDETRWDEYKRACAQAGGDRILLVPGMEYEDAADGVHVPVCGEGLR